MLLFKCRKKMFRWVVFVWLASLILLTGATALAQAGPSNFRVTETSYDSISVAWNRGSGIASYRISYSRSGGLERVAGSTSGSAFTITGLGSNTSYTIFLDYAGGYLSIEGRTARKPIPPKPPKIKPLVFTCTLLPASIVVSGYGRYTQCQQLDEIGVGNPELIAQGIVDAVDVWASVDTLIQVCFRNPGILKFLDAATSPRTVSDLAAETIDGMTCGSIDRAGTVVIMQTTGSAAEASEVSIEPAPTGPAEAEACQLVSTAYLSLRAGPSVYYARILAMPRGSRLIATARVGSWFLVTYEEQLGWVSGAYATLSAGCDALDDSGSVILLHVPDSAPGEPGAAEESEINPLTDCRLTAGDIINLRADAGLEHSVKAEIPNQTRLIAIERLGDWFKVDYDGITGWVNIDYVFRNGACG